MNELNEKLALKKKLLVFAGFELKTRVVHDSLSGREFEGGNWLQGYWVYPDGSEKISGPDFLFSSDACFKWLVPKVMDDWSQFLDIQVRRYIAPGQEGLLTRYICEIWSNCGKGTRVASAETPALALCKAIEKLIDEEAKE